MTRNTTLGIVLAAIVLVSAVATPVAADPMMEADPNDANTTATHKVVADVGPNDDGNSLNGLNVDYQDTTQNGDVKDVEKADIRKIGIDRDGDAGGTTIDVDVSDDLGDVGISNEGELLEIRLGGDYTLEDGDEVVVVYEDARNPEAGEYTIEFTVNPQSDGTKSSAAMTIGSSDDTPTPTDEPASDDETPTPTDGETTPTDGGEATPTDEETATDGGDDATPTAEADAAGDGGDRSAGGDADSSGDDGDSTDGDGSGFGVGGGLVALLAAALVARR